MTSSQQLRTRTSACHEAVDVAFGAHDLSRAGSYARVLVAHARALAPAEAALAGVPGLPDWRPRSNLLASDLAALGAPWPAPLPFSIVDAAEAWGTLYVLEGSRLGNAMLARQIAADLPSAYMSARHDQGGWRTLLAALDAAGQQGAAGWLDAAVRGAEATFALYLAAAGVEDIALATA